MTRKNLLLALAAVTAVALTATPAAAKPDFSGSWKLVADKSDFGPMPVPDKMEYAIEHKDPEVKAKVTQANQQGEATVEQTYSTDGKETTNTLRGNPVKSTTKWDGDKMVINSKIDFQGNEITLSDAWVLAEDGKTVTITRKINSPMGELEQKIVLAKQ
ncbi:MAG: hypothetical protein HY820_31980 [Acidobacteria bacterium]|nr:hypothetical protein [Acidobacteriota bacterium]